MTASPERSRLPRRQASAFCALAFVMSAGACSEVAVPAPAPLLEMSIAAGGTAGTLPINTFAAVAPTILITDADGDPVPNIPILFSPTRGSGLLGQYAVYTGPDGVASASSWYFGSRAGPQEVVAVLHGLVGDASATFTGTALPGPPTRVSFSVPTFNIQVAATAQLSLFPADEFRNPTGAALAATFATSDASIVSVSGTGLVTGHRLGAARIIATSGPDADTSYVGVGIRPHGGHSGSFLTSQEPFAVAIGTEGVIYAIGGSGGLFHAYSPGTGVSPWYLPLEGPAIDLALTPDLSKAAVAQHSVNAVRIVDLASRSVVRVVTGLGTPIRVAVSPDGAHAFVGTTSTALHRVDLTTGAFTSVTLDGGSNGLEVDAERGVLYASTLTGTLYEVSLAAFAVLRSVPLGGLPQGISLAPDGRLFVANEGLGLQVVDIAGFTLDTTIAGVTAPYDVQVTRDGMEVYVASSAASTLSVVHAFTLEVLRSAGGGEFRRIGISPDGRVIAVAREASVGFGITVVR